MNKIFKSYLKRLNEEEKKEVYTVGKHNGVPDSEFDPKELEMGIKVEMEHTDDPFIAKCIAKDHLSEPGLSDYYTRLKKMEEDSGVKD